jgi:transposase
MARSWPSASKAPVPSDPSWAGSCGPTRSPWSRWTGPTAGPAGKSDPGRAVSTALRRLARRYQYLTEEIADADAELKPLVAQAAPPLLALPGIGTETAAQLLITAGDNPDRLTSEASFAHLCAAAPIPAGSGRTNRHRLNRGGDRQANNALHTIALVRMRHDTRTQDYVPRRTTEGMTKKDILRCLKRFIAREVYKHLTPPPTTPQPLPQTV